MAPSTRVLPSLAAAAASAPPVGVVGTSSDGPTVSGTASPVRTAARAAAISAGAAVGLATVGTTALAAYFTRRVLTPDHVKPDDVVVHDVDRDAEPPTVTLGRTDETVAPGRYGLWWGERGQNHARLGDVLHADDDLVVRELLAVDRGDLAAGPARWNQYYFSGTPDDALGLAHEDVELATDVGPMPAWYVPAAAADRQGSGAWAVLVPSYRNDVDAPSDPSGRYHLGDSEWRDVEAAVLWAVERGAREVVLLGWSMGGAIVLQAATRSWVADRVRAVVLDGPVVDWHAVLDHQSTINRVPASVTRIGHTMMRHPL